ncbi:MAG: C_GCAxxG_C_C family protein [Anaerolineaceae bacterium]|nr:C_GCAxxG_C_C family protein [Anaerolineaceae bacterium]
MIKQKSIQEIARKGFEKGYQLEKNLKICSQCSLAAILETLDMPYEHLIKAFSGFGGGIGKSAKGVCGALIGGTAAISCFFGRDYDDFLTGESISDNCLILSRKLIKIFEQEYDGITCASVQTHLMGKSFDLFIPEEKTAFDAVDGNEHCSIVVGKASQWAIELILEEKEKQKGE